MSSFVKIALLFSSMVSIHVGLTPPNRPPPVDVQFIPTEKGSVRTSEVVLRRILSSGGPATYFKVSALCFFTDGTDMLNFTVFLTGAILDCLHTRIHTYPLSILSPVTRIPTHGNPLPHLDRHVPYNALPRHLHPNHALWRLPSRPLLPGIGEILYLRALSAREP